MAAPTDLMRKFEMCDFTHLKRVQLCVKPAGFLVWELGQIVFRINNYGK